MKGLTWYAMMFEEFLDKFPNMVFEKWERDVGDIPEDQWEEVLESVLLCFLNIAQLFKQCYTESTSHST